MQIVCLMGSPRRQGNSTALAECFTARAEQLGARIQTFVLNDLQMRGCQACEACKIGLDHCVVEDGLSEVLEAVLHADALVFASPVYYGDVSAQLKTFIDRSYSYLKPRYITLDHPSRFPERKPLVFILAQGHRDVEVFADILPRYSELFRWTGFADVTPVRVIDVYHPGDVASRRPDLFAHLEQLAAELVTAWREQNDAG